MQRRDLYLRGSHVAQDSETVPLFTFQPTPLTNALRTNALRSVALGIGAAALLLGTANIARADAPAWLEKASAACAEEFGDSRCDDEKFLQQQYAPETLAATREVARKAAVRRNRMEQRALREVLVQHTGLCDQKPAQYCPPNNLAACTEQLRQTCASIKQQAAMCEAQTETYCAQHNGTSKCLEAMKNQCGNANLSIDQILAKYPALSPSQKAKLKQVATQLETNREKSVFGELASTFLNLLGFGAAL